MVFRPDLSWEFFTTDEIETRTLRAIRNHIRHVKSVSPYYRRVLNDIAPEDIAAFDAFQRLPLTDTGTVRGEINAFVGVEASEIAETFITSGREGAPLVVPMTAGDLDRMAYSQALCLQAADVAPQDRLQIVCDLNVPSVGGMPSYRGAILLGANVLRSGLMSADEMSRYIALFRPTVLIGIPSHLVGLGRELAGAGKERPVASLQSIICLRETVRTHTMEANSIGRELEQLYGTRFFSCYEAIEHSVGYCECSQQQGCHSQPELVFTEIVDSDGQPVPPGKPGELVVTPLGTEGLPLVRYRTGDISFLLEGPCSCGRNSKRIGPILGRVSQQFMIDGDSVYPYLITDFLDTIPEIEDYALIIDNSGTAASDSIAVHVAASPRILEHITSSLRARIGVNIPLLISNIQTIAHLRGMNNVAARVIDKRK